MQLAIVKTAHISGEQKHKMHVHRLEGNEQLELTMCMNLILNSVKKWRKNYGTHI